MIIPIGHIKRLGLWAFAAAAALLAGCTGDADIEDPAVSRPSEYLSFTATLASEGSSAVGRGTSGHLETEIARWALLPAPEGGDDTRGSLSTALSGNAGVMGFTYNTDNDGAVKDKAALAAGNNIEFVFNGNTLASAGTPIRWNAINKGNMGIFAYAPHTVDGLTVNNNTASDPTLTYTPPTLTYTVPNNVADHKDIIVSRWEGAIGEYKTNNRPIPLTFDHALTAVRFKVGFDCTVKSVKLEGVYKKGTYSFSSGKWTADATSTGTYTVDFGAGKTFAKNAMLTDGDNTMILLPQTPLPNGAKITLTCTDKTLTATIGGNGTTWEAGKLITYTLHDKPLAEPVYFDLAAGNVFIKGEDTTPTDATTPTDEEKELESNTYEGHVYKKKIVNGVETTVTETVKGTHQSGNRYYVYQSTADNRGDIIWNGDTPTNLPTYPEVKGPDGRPWREFITNNDNVESVIDVWSWSKTGSPRYNDDLATKNAGRSRTSYRIGISGNVTCELTIDNIYSTFQQPSASRTKAGISFAPVRYDPNVKGAKVTIKILGDNRIGAVHYANWPSGNDNQIIFEGTGSLTVADVDGNIKTAKEDNNNIGVDVGESGYYSNFWDSAIGGADGGEEAVYGLVINSGTIFAGTTKAENCTAIGGGGNAHGQVTINGGVVTAVATTTGTAIGGGIGFNSFGGTGDVTINGGNVYAYNLANRWNIPSSAIGGAGSREKYGNTGTVNITGGYVYAYSALGTAIGGGSSYTMQGGNATINITGGEVIAKTDSEESASIGGGTACTGGGSSTGTTHYNGGHAEITISATNGNPIIRTGSIGGGGTGDTKGRIGNAKIEVSGGDTQAQFILAAGTDTNKSNSFTMYGGKIQGSNTGDTDYINVKKDGGAVYLENGEVIIKGGTIENCCAERGGAIYISSTGTSTSTLMMTGGTIRGNDSNSDGGAIYMEGGKVIISGGTIANNLAVGGNGGGICISGGSFEMPEDGSASIQNNSAEANSSSGAFDSGNGGGVYISSAETNIDVKLHSGTISNNTAGRRGGGVCVYMDKDHGATVSVGLADGTANDPNIHSNHALIEGGGLYARGKNAHITIDSGTILHNTVSQYVYNSDVANEYGHVTLNNGEVTHVKVTFFANDGENSNTEPKTQKIVTSTNSTLVTPVFSRQGYKIVRWNTKPSGKGKDYKNGDLMNINTDISLYAIWDVDVH